MKDMLSTRWILALMLFAVCAAPAFGQNPIIDYLGYGWETGGILPSEPGDVLVFTCSGVAADPEFGVDLGVDELTFYIYDLVSEGQVDVGGNNLMISYTGGYLEIWRDGAQNADWGIDPPNATSPSTFTDGTLFFRGEFTYLTLFVNPVGNGVYEGGLNALDGEILGDVCDNCAYTWGGSFLKGTGAQIPDGYDLQIDGVFELDGAIGNENSAWGDVKSLYNN